jgi:hypothetical protein
VTLPTAFFYKLFGQSFERFLEIYGLLLPSSIVISRDVSSFKALARVLPSIQPSGSGTGTVPGMGAAVPTAGRSPSNTLLVTRLINWSPLILYQFLVSDEAQRCYSISNAFFSNALSFHDHVIEQLFPNRYDEKALIGGKLFELIKEAYMDISICFPHTIALEHEHITGDQFIGSSAIQKVLLPFIVSLSVPPVPPRPPFKALSAIIAILIPIYVSIMYIYI